MRVPPAMSPLPRPPALFLLSLLLLLLSCLASRVRRRAARAGPAPAQQRKQQQQQQQQQQLAVRPDAVLLRAASALLVRVAALAAHVTAVAAAILLTPVLISARRGRTWHARASAGAAALFAALMVPAASTAADRPPTEAAPSTSSSRKIVAAAAAAAAAAAVVVPKPAPAPAGAADTSYQGITRARDHGISTVTRQGRVSGAVETILTPSDPACSQRREGPGEASSASVDASSGVSKDTASLRHRYSSSRGTGPTGLDAGGGGDGRSHDPVSGGRSAHASVALPLGTGHGHASRRKTLVLDLDETLVHSQFKPTRHFDVRLDILIDRFSSVFFVAKRPYLDVFLRTAAMWYNLVIYTASLEKYADPLISCIDPDGLVERRLFRTSCAKVGGSFVKDITLIEPDLRDVIIVDNTPAAYSLFDANAIPIEPWFDDQKDEELLNLLPLLHAVAFLEDVRSLLGLRLTNGVLAARRPQSRAARARISGRSSSSRQEHVR